MVLQSLRHLISRKKTLGDDRANVAVEFAILAPAFLIIVMGIIDFGRLMWTKSTMQFTVEQTARYAIVNPDVNTATLEAYAENESTILSGVTYTATTSASGGINFRTIQASYVFTFLIPIIPISGITLTAKSSTPVSKS